MSMCRVLSCVVGRGCLLWPVHSLGKTLLAFALLHFELQGQIFLLLQVSLDFLPLYSSLLQWKRYIFVCVSIWRSCKSSQNHLISTSLTLVSWALTWYYCDVEWFVLEMNQVHSVIFEIATKYCVFGVFVYYEGYSIPSKGFLLIIVDNCHLN